MVFVYSRRIRFGDTDAAGVMYFTRALSICHEAYEESLIQFGIDLHIFVSQAAIAVPITHASIDYRKPSYCGDLQQVHLRPTQRSGNEFEIDYILYSAEAERLSQAKTRHVCIDRSDRRRVPISPDLLNWIKEYGGEDLKSF